MKNKDFFYILLISLLLLITNIFEQNIIGLIVLFFISYILLFINGYNKFKNIKSLIFSAEFIMLTLFFIYAIPGSLMYILDDYRPRIYFFLIDTVTVQNTLQIYLNIFNILFMLILFTGGINTLDTNIKLNNENIRNRINIFDIIAIILIIYFYYLHFRNGINIFSEYFQDLRLLIKSDAHNFNSYVYLYLISYSFVNLYKAIYSSEKSKQSQLKKILFIIVFISFWGLSILTDRRNLVQLLFLLLLLYFNKLRNIKLRTIIMVVIAILVLLFASFIRSGEKYSRDNINNVIHLSLGEFIYVNYVSDYYYNYNNSLLRGSTYYYDTITSFVPRSVFPNKPIPLGERFKKEGKTNVAYAFNPVAEGLINFGRVGAVFAVPIVIFLLIKLAYLVGKRNILLYYLILSEFLNFIRGTFSTTIFTIVVMTIFILLMIKKKEVEFK